MKWIRRCCWLLLAAAACLTNTEGEGAVTNVGPPVVELPTIALANCAEIDTDGACLVDPGPAKVRVWVDQHERSELRVRIGDRDADVSRRGADGGLLLEIEIEIESSEAAQRLTIESLDPVWRSTWEVVLRHRPIPAVVTAARKRQRQGDLQGAIDNLSIALPTLADEERLRALEHLCELHYSIRDLRAAAQRCTATVALAQRLARNRTAARAAASAVHILVYEFGELTEAVPMVRVLEDLALTLPEATVLSAFCQGLLARHFGDPTRAIEAFGAAAKGAERLGMDRELLTAREGLGITYGELARGTDALALARRMLVDADRPEIDCALRHSALNTAGWVQLLLQQRGVEHVPPGEFFERALALVEGSGECPTWTEEVNVLINLGLTALAEGQPAMALAWIERIDLVPAGYQPWVDEVVARAGIELGRRELIPTIMVSPDPSLPRALRWNAWMRHAAVAEHLGLREAAIDAYAEGEAIVAESVGAIGLDLGRELFVSGHQASARGLVRQLAAAGRDEDALCRARLARGRAVRLLDRAARLRAATPQQRTAWEADVSAVAELRRHLDADMALDIRRSVAEVKRRRAHRAPAEERARKRLEQAHARLGASALVEDCRDLPVVNEEEVLLLPFPLDDGWLLFVSDGVNVVASLTAEPPRDEGLRAWAEHALAAGATMLEGASELRVLPTGRSWDLPFHALAWRGGVLLDAAPVSYSLDLAAPTASSNKSPTPGSALVIADASKNLPHARREAHEVTTALEAMRWKVDRVEGEAVTRQRVEHLLPTATLLHYAGHGQYDGTTGWDARLRIGDGDGFGPMDVLALPHVPRAVVLSGCETGRTTQDTLAGGMSLGHAFILAGSAWVIVADERVDDALSRAMGAGLYDELGATHWDGPSALRRVQLRLRAADPDGGWETFRSIVR